MIHDVISNDTNHKNDRFLQKMGEKRLSKVEPWLQKCCMSISQ